jgi:adenosylcobinamide-GDP ribazoletransferase
MPPFLRAARAAVTELTRIPVGGFPYDETVWKWTSAWLPAVGAGLGLLYAAVWRATEAADPLVRAVLTVVTALLVTGAYHEDGLADTADALGGAYDRARLFEILKDSRVGSFGAAAITATLMLRVALLARLDARAAVALILAESLSRAVPVWLMAALPYVTPADLARSRPIAGGRAPQALVATLFTGTLLAVLIGGAYISVRLAVWVCVASAGIAVLCAWRFKARAGGITGDFLGASQQVSVSAILLTCILT